MSWRKSFLSVRLFLEARGDAQLQRKGLRRSEERGEGSCGSDWMLVACCTFLCISFYLEEVTEAVSPDGQRSGGKRPQLGMSLTKSLLLNTYGWHRIPQNLYHKWVQNSFSCAHLFSKECGQGKKGLALPSLPLAVFPFFLASSLSMQLGPAMFSSW